MSDTPSLRACMNTNPGYCGLTHPYVKRDGKFMPDLKWTCGRRAPKGSLHSSTPHVGERGRRAQSAPSIPAPPHIHKNMRMQSSGNRAAGGRRKAPSTPAPPHAHRRRQAGASM